MNLYDVEYKPYSWQSGTKHVSIVAANPFKALEGAKMVARKSGSSSPELLNVSMVQPIDRVER